MSANQTDPLLTLALSKVIKENASKEARAQCEQGVYPIDKSVRIQGVVSIKEDTMARPTSTLLRKEALIFILQRSGLQREKMLEILEETAQKAVEAVKVGGEWTTGDDLADLTKDFDMISKKLEIMLEELPKIKRNGAVSFTGNIEVLPDGRGVK